MDTSGWSGEVTTVHGTDPSQPGWFATTRIIARNTWYLSWRDPLTRLELGMLALLALFSAIATIGSPTAGDGAIQMFAISYTVTPFALVLIIGQIARGGANEVAWWSRPVSRSQYYAGRFLGYLGVGAGLLGIIGGLGTLLMSAIAHLSVVSSLMWSFWFLLAAAPSLVTLIGGCLLLLQRFGPGIRYFTPAILLSLVMAFAGYKWQALSQSTPHLAFWNPFPGFLTLGLALPPGLLGSVPISHWIWWNRLIYGEIGLLFLTLAIGWPGKYGASYPLQKRRTHRALFALLSLGVIGVAIVFALVTRSLSPVVLSGTPILPIEGTGSSMNPQTVVAQMGVQVKLTVNPGTGRIVGTATYPALSSSDTEFALNVGLQPVSAVDRYGHLLVMHAVHQNAVLPGTAATLWRIQNEGKIKSPITLRYQGTLFPRASTLPYPPFTVNHVYDSMDAGQGRIFLVGPGTWMPLFLQTGEQPVLTLPQGILTLQNAATPLGTTAKFTTPVISNLRYNIHTHTYQGSLQTAVFLTAPYVTTPLNGLQIYSRRPLAPTDLTAYDPYQQAWSQLHVLIHDMGSIRSPSASSPFPATVKRSGSANTHKLGILKVITSPVTSSPTLTGNILLISEVHPYQRPADPVTGSTDRATPESALGTLSFLWWQEVASPLTGVFAPAETTTQNQACGVMATLDLLYLSHGLSQANLVGEVYHGNIPGIGRLNHTQIQQVLDEWPRVRTMSALQWAQTRRRLAVFLANRQIRWPQLDAVLFQTP